MGLVKKNSVPLVEGRSRVVGLCNICGSISKRLSRSNVHPVYSNVKFTFYRMKEKKSEKYRKLFDCLCSSVNWVFFCSLYFCYVNKINRITSFASVCTKVKKKNLPSIDSRISRKKKSKNFVLSWYLYKTKKTNFSSISAAGEKKNICFEGNKRNKQIKREH